MADPRPPRLTGEQHPRAKLTMAQVKKVAFLRKNGLTQAQVAERLGVSQSLVSRIENGLRWINERNKA